MEKELGEIIQSLAELETQLTLANKNRKAYILEELFDDLANALAYNNLEEARKILRDAEDEVKAIYNEINNIDKFIDYINSLADKIQIDVEMIEDLEKEFAKVENLIF